MTFSNLSIVLIGLTSNCSGASQEGEQVDRLAYQARLFNIEFNCDHVRLKTLARSEDNRVIVTDPSVKPVSK